MKEIRRFRVNLSGPNIFRSNEFECELGVLEKIKWEEQLEKIQQLKISEVTEMTLTTVFRIERIS